MPLLLLPLLLPPVLRPLLPMLLLPLLLPPIPPFNMSSVFCSVIAPRPLGFESSYD